MRKKNFFIGLGTILLSLYFLGEACAEAQDNEDIVDVLSLVQQTRSTEPGSVNINEFSGSVASDQFKRDRGFIVPVDEGYRRYAYAVESGLCEGPDETKPPECIYKSTPRTFSSFKVSRFATPYQAQIVTTEAYASTSALKREHPNKALWELRHVCGATVISDRWAITAAHCLTDDPKPEHFGLRLDVGNISQMESKAVPVKNIIRHEDFRRRDLMHDIALLEFDPGGRKILDVKARTTGETLQFFGYGVVETQFSTLTSNGLLQTFDIKTGKNIRHKILPSRFTENVSEISLDPTGKYATVIRKNGFDVHFLDRDQMPLSVEIPNLSSKNFKLFPETNEAILVDQQGRVKIFDLEDTRNQHEFETQAYFKPSLRLSSSRILLENSGSFALWDTKNGRQIAGGQIGDFGFRSFYNAGIKRLTLSGDKNTIVLDIETGNTVLDVKTDAPLRELGGMMGKSTVLATLEYPRKVNLFDMITGEDLGDFKPAFTPYKSLFSETGKEILVWSQAGELELWDIRTKRRMSSFKAAFSPDLSTVEFFDNGRRLFIGDRSGRSEVWDPRQGLKKTEFEHSVSLASFAFTQDKNYVVARSDLGTVEILNLVKGKSVARIFHSREISGARLINRGQTLISWDDYGRVKTWDVPTATEKTRTIATVIGGGSSRADNRPLLVGAIDIGGLPSQSDDPLTVQSIGWGKTKPVTGRAPSAVLGLISLTVMSREDCLSKTGWSDHVIHDGVFCASDKRRKTCYGDSGGPVVLADERFGDKLVGIVSWGSNECGEDKVPSVYTNMSRYTSWVRGKICIESGPEKYWPSTICGAERLPMLD